MKSTSENIRKPIKYLFLLLGFLAISSLYFSLNYSGFCFGELRYLSDYEQKKAVFDYQNNRAFPPIPKKEVKSPRQLTPYKSFEEYLELYPDCCFIGRDSIPDNKNKNWGSSVPYGTHSLLNRIFGNSSGNTYYIELYYQYVSNGRERRNYPVRYANSINNCGKVIW